MPPAAAEKPEPTAARSLPAPPAPIIANSSTSATAPSPFTAIQPGDPIDSEDVARLMADLIGSDQSVSKDALDSIVEAGDTRFISVLLELIRGRQIGIVGGSYSDYFEATS